MKSTKLSLLFFFGVSALYGAYYYYRTLSDSEDDESQEKITEDKEEIVKPGKSAGQEDNRHNGEIDVTVVTQCLIELEKAVENSYQNMINQIANVTETMSKEQMAARLVPALKEISVTRSRISTRYSVGEVELRSFIELYSHVERVSKLNASIDSKLSLLKNTFKDAVQRAEMI